MDDVEAVVLNGITALSVGDYVEKFSGEARYTGWIVSVYKTRKGSVRYVVEVDPQGFQMIVTAGMIRLATDHASPSDGDQS